MSTLGPPDPGAFWWGWGGVRQYEWRLSNAGGRLANRPYQIVGVHWRCWLTFALGNFMLFWFIGCRGRRAAREPPLPDCWLTFALGGVHAFLVHRLLVAAGGPRAAPTRLLAGVCLGGSSCFPGSLVVGSVRCIVDLQLESAKLPASSSTCV